MTFRFSKREIVTLVLSVIIIIGFIIAGYFMYLSPKKLDIETNGITLKSEQDVLAALQEKQPQQVDLTVESVAMLQRKVPVKPQLEKLILDLEKAEVVSGSIIKSYSFSEADVTGAAQQAQQQNTNQQQNQNEKNAENGEQNTENNNQEDTANNQNGDNKERNDTDEESNETNQPPVIEYVPTPLPGGIKKVTVSLQVESSDYEELRIFIETIETLQRVLVVETVGFAGKEEKTEISDDDEKITYSITLSAFYMPSLTDLANRLPELASPQPGNKAYPFYEFPYTPLQ